MAQYDIFISYSRKDTVVADQVCEALDKANISYFIDRQGIGGGMEFPVIIADAICECRLFLFLASKNSYQSKFTNNEITFAFNEKPKQSILPYIIDGTELPRHMRFVFAGINWRNIKDHPIQTVLVSDIAKLLGKETHSYLLGARHNVKIITPKQVDLIGKLMTQLNPLPNILTDVICTKKQYSSVIRVKSYKFVSTVGVAIIGEVLYGSSIASNGNYLIKSIGQKGIKSNAVLTHDIANETCYQEIIIRTLRRFFPLKSDYDICLSLLAETANMKMYNSLSCVKPGNIVGLILSGITMKHMENCKFIYKLD